LRIDLYGDALSVHMDVERVRVKADIGACSAQDHSLCGTIETVTMLFTIGTGGHDA